MSKTLATICWIFTALANLADEAPAPAPAPPVQPVLELRYEADPDYTSAPED